MESRAGKKLSESVNRFAHSWSTDGVSSNDNEDVPFPVDDCVVAVSSDINMERSKSRAKSGLVIFGSDSMARR